MTIALGWNDVAGSSSSGTTVDTSAPRVPGPQREEGLPAGGVQRPDQEVGLAPEAGVDAGLQPRRVRLPEQVDLQRGVDRDHRRAARRSAAGSFVRSVRSIRTRGLRSTQA